jgi:hypothetical protein
VRAALLVFSARGEQTFSRGCVMRDATTEPRPPPIERAYITATLDEHKRLCIIELKLVVGVDLSGAECADRRDQRALSG